MASSAHAFLVEDPVASATKIKMAPAVLEIRINRGIATNRSEGQLLVKSHRGRFRPKTSGPQSAGKIDKYSLLTRTDRRSGRGSMPFRRDPAWETLDLTVSPRRHATTHEREGRYAASGFIKNLCNINDLTKSSQFGMDARPKPVLPPFRLCRRPSQRLSSFGIFADNLCLSSQNYERRSGVIVKAFRNEALK